MSPNPCHWNTTAGGFDADVGKSIWNDRGNSPIWTPEFRPLEIFRPSGHDSADVGAPPPAPALPPVPALPPAPEAAGGASSVEPPHAARAQSNTADSSFFSGVNMFQLASLPRPTRGW